MQILPTRTLLLFAVLLANSPLLWGQELELPKTSHPGTGSHLASKLIFSLEERPTPQCHASTIAELPSGLIAAWFGGTHEQNPDVGIWVSRYRNSTWSRPVQVVDGSEGENRQYACWNPVLFQPSNGPLMLFYKVGLSPIMWWGMLVTSKDSVTWSQPQKLGTSPKLGQENPNLLGPVKNKPIQLADGSILCASSTEHDGWRVHFERTRDLGQSWEIIGPINDASQFDAIQPSILHYTDGRIQILCRTKENVIGQSWSHDEGETWTKVEASKLPNPNAGLDAVTLRDGRQLLVYNHTVRSSTRDGRQMLNVAVSEDGRKWRPVLTLEKEDKQAEFSYPAVIQTNDGKIHITYTWQRISVKHVVLDPDKIE